LDGDSDDVFEVRTDTILDAVEKLNLSSEEEGAKDALRRLFALAQWSITAQPQDIITLNTPGFNYSVAWRKDLLLKNGIENQIKSRINSFDHGERIAFRIPVKVQPVGRNPEMSSFRVYLE